jgi:predicted transcriptional regulator
LLLLVFTLEGVPTWEVRTDPKKDDLLATGTADSFAAAKMAALFECQRDEREFTTLRVPIKSITSCLAAPRNRPHHAGRAVRLRRPVVARYGQRQPRSIRSPVKVAMSESTSPSLLQLTADIVAAHAAHNHVTPETLLQMIGSVHGALATAGTSAPVAEKQQPALAVKRSVFPDHIVCLEDGKKLKTLKRHLKTSYGMTPEQYRTVEVLI